MNFSQLGEREIGQFAGWRYYRPVMHELQQLEVPLGLSPLRSGADALASPSAACDAWPQHAVPALGRLAERVRSEGQGADRRLLADAAIASARFVPLAVPGGIPPAFLDYEAAACGAWCTQECTKAAQSVLEAIDAAQSSGDALLTLVERVLLDYIKPLFAKAAQKGRVDTATGRARRGDGDAHPVWAAGSEDEDDATPAWAKSAGRHSVDGATTDAALGVWNVLGWCIVRVRTEACQGDDERRCLAVWERFWPMLVPAILALLDETQARAKLYGARLAGLLLPNGERGVPPVLLERTGLGTLLDEALTRAMYHMTDARDGAALLHASIEARRVLANAIYTRSGSLEAQEALFDARCRVFSEGVLGALSYCAPASSSTHALRPSEAAARMPTLSSARLQQSLAGVAHTAAQPLLADLGGSSVRFWNAVMDWSVGWLSEAFAACYTPFPTRAPPTDLGQLVDEAERAVQDGVPVETPVPAPVDAWEEAARVLLESVRLSAETVRAAADAAAHAEQDTETASAPADGAPPAIPATLPGAHVWGTRIITAAAQCWLRLVDLGVLTPADVGAASASAPPDSVRAHGVQLGAALAAMCHALIRVDKTLYPVRLFAARHRTDPCLQRAAEVQAVDPARLAPLLGADAPTCA